MLIKFLWCKFKISEQKKNPSGVVKLSTIGLCDDTKNGMLM